MEFKYPHQKLNSNDVTLFTGKDMTLNINKRHSDPFSKLNKPKEQYAEDPHNVVELGEINDILFKMGKYLIK